MASLRDDILALVENISTLSRTLPASIPLGTESDKMYRVLNLEEGETPYATFNRRFDLLFKEDNDCRDKQGRLHYIRRGPHGMIKLSTYLRKIDWADMPLDLVKLKLDRVNEELVYLISNASEEDLETLSEKPRIKLKGPKVATDGQSRSQASKFDHIFEQAIAPKGNKTSSKPHKKTKSKIVSGTESSKLSTSNRILKQALSTKGKKSSSKSDKTTKSTAKADKPDTDYQPRARYPSEESISPIELDGNGIEVVPGENEQRKRKRVVNSSSDNDSEDTDTEQSKKKAKKSTKAKSSDIKVIEIDSGDESESESPSKTQKKGPVNTSRQHFKEPIATQKNGNKRWEFQCKHCKCSLTFPRTVRSGTAFEDESTQPPLGNLATHIRKAHPNADTPTTNDGPTPKISVSSAKIMGDFLKEGILNPQLVRTQTGFYKVFAAWILEDDLPFMTGETVGIHRLFAYMESRFLLPSDTTVRNTLAKIYAELYSDVKKELKNVKSKIAISTDTWSTRSMMFSFAGTLACWVTEDWELIERVVDFHPLEDREHEGAYAAKNLAKMLSDWGILEKITITLDNAAPNNVLLATLSRLLIEKFDIQFVPDNSQIRCLGHVVNIVVQKILAVLDEAEDPDKIDYYDKSLPIHLDLEEEAYDNDDIDSEDEDDDNLDEIIMQDLLVESNGEMSALQRLRTICTKIVSSPQRRQQFRNAACKMYPGEKTEAGTNINTLMVVRDVRTRWNWTHAMIKRALILKKAIDRWLRSYSELNPLRLNEEDWKLLESLKTLLDIFTKVTLQMSCAGTPTLPWVLPMYEHMIKALKNYIDNSSQPPSLVSAARAGLSKLNEYYQKACGCQYNVIATLLHPYLGISWFRKLGNDRAEHASTLFKHVYAEYAKQHPPAPIQKSGLSSNKPLGFLDDVSMTSVDDPCPPSVSEVAGELERFFAAPNVFGRGVPNTPLHWWKLYHHEFPVIALMARDFLAIPGTSVSVERLFSKSRHLCTDVRSSLRATTIMTAMLTKSWIKQGLLKFITAKTTS